MQALRSYPAVVTAIGGLPLAIDTKVRKKYDICKYLTAYMSLNISYLARKRDDSSIKKGHFRSHRGARRPRGARTTMKNTRGRGAGRGQAAPNPQQAQII